MVPVGSRHGLGNHIPQHVQLRVGYCNVNVANADKIARVAETLTQCDVIMLAEVGHYTYDISGFTKFHHTEVPMAALSQRSTGKGTGVVVYIRTCYARYTQVVHTDTRGVWLKVCPSSSDLPPLILACVYLNPSRSTVERKAMFECVEQQLVQTIQMGRVMVMGDFNAHTGMIPDRQHVDPDIFEEMRIAGMIQTLHNPPSRVNSDAHSVNAYGHELINLCRQTGVIMCNGRIPGDQHGASTCGRDGSEASVIDYCLVNDAMYGCIQRFEVGPAVEWSDHKPLVTEITLPMQQLQLSHHTNGENVVDQAGMSHKQVPKWIPQKREAFGQTLDSGINSDTLQGILDGLGSGRMDTLHAVQQFEALLHTTACQVFGVVSSSNPNARQQPNPWFKHCKTEWRLLQQAIARGDTHAAREYKRTFNTVKRRWKRRYNKQVFARLEDEWKHNPRKFWRFFKGGRRQEMVHDVHEWGMYWRTLFGTSEAAQMPAGWDQLVHLLEDITLDKRAKATPLNNAITMAEVAAALNKLKRGKAAGPDGIRAEFIKDAVVREPDVEDTGVPVYRNVLLPVVHALIANVFETGTFPVGWSQAAISAVAKHGDMNDQNNYRGIAVGNIMGKLYSMVLEARLTEWCETHKLRAAGQAGFRKKRRTTDQLFILRHIIQRCKLQQQQLYCCFVDFKKAYDSVDRQLLMQELIQRGIGGNMLRAIRNMYQNVPMCARVQGCVSEYFSSTIGVKQGDPLSPLLFGLFIDRIETFLREHASGTGVDVGMAGLVCQMLLYADDIVLVAKSAADLQKQIDALSQFCAEQKLTVNVTKTKVMVVGAAHNTSEVWRYRGEGIEQVQQFRYLGVVIDAVKGVHCAHEVVHATATKAMWSMMQQVRERHINNTKVRVRLFNALVMPVLEYACEIWGTQFVRDPYNPINNPLQPVQSLFLRHVTGTWIRKCVSHKIVMAEFGCKPVAWKWCELICNYWNRLLKSPKDEWLYHAFVGDLSMTVASPLQRGLTQQRKVYGQLWCDDVLDMFRKCMPEYATTVERCVQYNTIDQIPPIHVNVAMGNIQRAWWVWPQPNTDPRTTDSANVTLATYTEWMNGIAIGAAPYITHQQYIAPMYMSSLIKFRLGSHQLRITTGRWDKTPRHARVCRFCAEGVEDEYHVLMECRYYQNCRTQAAQLFENTTCMRSVMCHKQQHLVAKLLYRIEEQRNALLRDNVRTDPPLDTFDSDSD